MRKHLIFCFIVCSLTMYSNHTMAQQTYGQIVINAGEGYSPEFDGEIGIGNPFSWSYPWYPVSTFLASVNTTYAYDYPPDFYCSSITSNKGGAMDVGVIDFFSIGFAASSQSEVVNWTPNEGGPWHLNFSDRISRINLAVRLLFHLPMSWTTKYFDPYGGFRIGESRWNDIPSANNSTYTYLTTGQILAYFINKPNLVVPSFQVLFGLHFYPIKFIGIHAEAAIGSPYLVEAGLTIRISTHKTKEDMGDKIIKALNKTNKT
jgi:hypothetical protein